MYKEACWQDCGDGWEALETTILLSGWTRERRVVLVRETPARAPVLQDGKRPRGKDRQQYLPHAKGSGWDPQPTPWCGKIAVLVTSLDEITHPTTSMPCHYRDRADAENCFDELKNQWGWSGFTTKKLASCRLMANLIALFYNWWSLYLRFYDAEHHREAIRTRPMLMAGVGRQIQSGGRKTIRVSVIHEKGDDITCAVSLVSKKLYEISAITEQWTPLQRWTLILTLLLRQWIGGKWLDGLPEGAEILLSG